MTQIDRSETSIIVLAATSGQVTAVVYDEDNQTEYGVTLWADGAVVSSDDPMGHLTHLYGIRVDKHGKRISKRVRLALAQIAREYQDKFASLAGSTFTIEEHVHV